MDQRGIGRLPGIVVAVVLVAAAVGLVYEYLATGQLWALIATIVVFAGFAAALYFLVLRRKGETLAEGPSAPAPEAAAPAKRPAPPPAEEAAPPPAPVRVAARSTVVVGAFERKAVRMDVRPGDHVTGTVRETTGQPFGWGVADFSTHMAFQNGAGVRMSPGGTGRSEYSVDFVAPDTALYVELWVDEATTARSILVDLARG